MMAPVSVEEENYVRLALLINGVAPRAVRTCFDSNFPPTYLPSTLNTKYNILHDLKFRKVLTQKQWDLLFPTNGVPDSMTFDVTLMICLIRSLTCIAEPIKGYNRPPLPQETTPGADLARIKSYRNSLAHDSYKIATADFNIAWSNISDAVSRLGGQQMKQECQELKVKILDQSNQQIMLEIKEVQKQIEEIRLELKDPIPWNIKVQIQEVLKTWTEDDKMFVETNGAKSVLKCIQEKSCVVVTGSSGTGKSALVRHIALQMQAGGYDIVPVTNPDEISKWYFPSKKTLFVVDDFCGTYTISLMKVEIWKSQMEKIKTLIEKNPVKIILSSRLQVYKDKRMKSLSFYQSSECNLMSVGLGLSKTEKQSIAELYLKKDASAIQELHDKFDCFPLLCNLYSKNTKMRIVDFFNNPFEVYKEEIDYLQTEGAHGKYCALALCVMFNNRLKEKWLTEDVDKDIKTVIKNTYEACKVVKGTSRLVLLDELDSLSDTFIRKDCEVYRTIHDKLFDFLAFYFGGVMIYCLIKNASSYFISERFIFEKKANCHEFMINVPERYQQMYINRMVDDWSKGKVLDVFVNINFDDQIFRKRFLVHVKHLEISQQERLASLCDRKNQSSPLLACCYIGYKDLVTWCLHHCINNVNYCRDDGVSPLFGACQEGHTEVIHMLINERANINKCNDNGASPLLIACEEGHIEVVDILINNKADINKCTDIGVSPLCIACDKGHAEVVQLLINSKADVNRCNDNGASPLLIACEEGHTEVVDILINNKADINKCTDIGVSPLCIACYKGHAEVVQLLINSKADVNRCIDTGASPLFMACQNGHIEIIKILIDNQADIYKCTDTGASPLYVACENRHIVIVQMLIQNKADINKCIDTGASPLFMGCDRGYIEVVRLLINNKADINKCKDIGLLPEVNAYRTIGITERVKMSINNQSSNNQHKTTKQSPIFIACYRGHINIVELLLNHKADCNIAWGEFTPLEVAKRENHTQIVDLFHRQNE